MRIFSCMCFSAKTGKICAARGGFERIGDGRIDSLGNLVSVWMC